MASERTQLARKHILYSLLLKVVSIGLTLALVPMTLHYLDNARYGIWLTLSSLVAWVGFFDIGITHGFKNKFTEMVALGNYEKARQYVSTTYVTIIMIFVPITILLCILSFEVDWAALLKVESNLYELQVTFAMIMLFFGINFVLNVVSIMLTADQRPAYSSLILTIGQAVSLLVIFILTKCTASSLIYLALALSGIPPLILLISSFIVFRSERYSKFQPQKNAVDFSLNKDIIGLGGKFFFIIIFMLLIFQLINLIISRVEGAEAVTVYNIAYKYFNVVLMFAMIILQPFWSSFTDAYTKKDFRWMNQTIKKLEMFAVLLLPVLIIMVLCAEEIFKLWLGGTVHVDFKMVVSVAFYMFCCIIANVYMIPINGTGKVLIQMIIYGVFSLFSFPLMYFLCEKYDSSIMMLVPSMVYITQAISGKIQLSKIIRNADAGLWSK